MSNNKTLDNDKIITQQLKRLVEFSLETKHFQSISDNINNVYDNGYINTYSDSYIFILAIMPEEDNREYFFQNLNNFQEYIKQNTNKKVTHQQDLLKLIDYLKLECSRFLDLEKKVAYLNGRVQQEYEHVTSDIHKEVAEVEKSNNSVREELQNSTSKYVSILSIFAGIVIAFMGGMSLLNGAFSALQNNISIYRVVFMLSLVGFILYNTIISLMFIVGRFNNKSIGNKCAYSSNDNECKTCSKFKGNATLLNSLCKVMHKYPYTGLVNIVLLYTMYIDFIMWIFSTHNKEIFKAVIKKFDWLTHWDGQIFLLIFPILIVISLILFPLLFKTIFKRIFLKK